MMATQNACFTRLFGSNLHCINDQNMHKTVPIMPKCCPRIVTHDKCSMMQCSVRVSGLTKVINCLPKSKSEVELENETTDNSQSVRVKFQLEKECEFGDSFLIVGDDPILGLWNPLEAIPFNWSEGHIWSLLLDLPVEKTIQYKILLKKSTGEILWQPGPDRSIQTWETKNVISVTEEWDNAEARNISEEQYIEEIHEQSASDSTEGSSKEHESSTISHVEALGSGENISIEDRDKATLKPDLSSIAVSKDGSSDKNPQKKVVYDQGNERSVKAETITTETEEVNLIIDDEGPVLVPGLTLPYSSPAEGHAKEKSKTVRSDN